MPEQRLQHIDETLVKLLEEIAGLREWVKNQIENERRDRRKWMIVLSLGVVGALLVSAALYGLVNRVDDQANLAEYRDCVRTNDGREGIYNAMDVLIAELANGQEDDPVIQERVDRFNSSLRAELPMRECVLGDG